MATPSPERMQGASPKIFHDRVTMHVRPRRGARLAAMTSGGTIPESGNYDVVIASQSRKIGDVEEDFAQESIARHDVFSLGSMPWRILRHLQEPADGRAGARDGADAAVLADRSGGPLACVVGRSAPRLRREIADVASAQSDGW